MEADQYEHQSESQDLVDYGPQGYHPVSLGEQFNGGMYTVVQKLGWGHFSTVWLVYKQATKQYLALKIQRSKESHTESAIDELQMLTEVRKHEQDPQWLAFMQQYQKEYPQLFASRLCRPLLLIDNFAHHGIHGKHMCSVFQLMGPNLLDLIQHYEFKDKRMPVWLVKKLTRDVLMGLVYLHERCHIIHTDLKPENIMIKIEPYEEQQLIQQLKSYKVKPLSMKYLRNLTATKNPKNKKKQEKKKKKKKAQEAENEGKEEEESKQSGDIKKQQGVEGQPSNIESEESNRVLKDKEMEIEPKVAEININQQLKVQQPSVPETAKVETKQQQQEWEDIQDGVDMSILDWKSVKIRLNNKLFFKIVDMGNACFTHKHFTQEIQTRQYRSPEVLLGHQYDCSTDIFSLGCCVFEMLTNNFLFKPKRIAGIKKNQDHLYQMLQLLGPIDKQFAVNGKYSSEVFNKKGKLLNGNPKRIEPISKLLHEKYDYHPQMAVAIEQFLLPMLAFEPKMRVDARTCLQSKWLWT